MKAPSAIRRPPSVRVPLGQRRRFPMRDDGALTETLWRTQRGRPVRDFRGLRVWQAAHRLTLNVYRATRDFPVDERFGLRSQMRRAAASIPTNIAEACGRRGEGDQGRFFQFSLGSACELEYQLQLSFDLQFLPESQWKELTTETRDVKRMLSGLTRPRTADGGRRTA